MKLLYFGNSLIILFFTLLSACVKQTKTDENKINLFFNQGFLTYGDYSHQEAEIKKYIKRTDSKCTDHYITEINFDNLPYFQKHKIKGTCSLKQTVLGCNPFSLNDSRLTVQNNENLFYEIEHIQDVLNTQFPESKIHKVSARTVNLDSKPSSNFSYLISNQHSTIYRSVYSLSWRDNAIEIIFEVKGQFTLETEIFENKFIDNLNFENP